MYIKFTGNQVIKYPYTLDDLRQDNPNMSFGAVVEPETLDALGVGVVLGTVKPDNIDPKKNVVEAQPVCVDGVWTQQWEVIDLTEEEFTQLKEQKASEVRSRRDDLLAMSDWAMILDAPLTEAQREEWKHYRSQLRSISERSNFPFDVVFPVEPIYVAPVQSGASPVRIE